jgi:hypothetical protein
MHEIPAEAGNRYIAMIIHVFFLLVKELNIGLRVLATKGEGDKEIVIVFWGKRMRQGASLDPT